MVAQQLEIYCVDHHGTHPLGNNALAHAIWLAAKVRHPVLDRALEGVAS